MAVCAWCGGAVTVRQTVVGIPGLLVLHRQCVPGWVKHEEGKMGEQSHDKPEHPHEGEEHPGEGHGRPEDPGQPGPPPGHGGTPPGQEPRPTHPIVEPDEEDEEEAQPKE